MSTVTSTALYLADNGACYCGAHLGVTARTTGHDLSGQPVLRLDGPEIAAAGEDPSIFACESCGRGM